MLLDQAEGVSHVLRHAFNRSLSEPMHYLMCPSYSQILLILKEEVCHEVVVLELDEAEAFFLGGGLEDGLGQQDLADFGLGDLEDLFELGGGLLICLQSWQVAHENSVDEVSRGVLLGRHFLVEFSLIKVLWVFRIRVQYHFILFAGDLDTGYPRAFLGQLEVLVGIASVIEPELEHIVIQVQAHCYHSLCRCLERSEDLGVSNRVKNSHSCINCKDTKLTEVVAADGGYDFPQMQAMGERHVSQHEFFGWSASFLGWGLGYLHLEAYTCLVKIFNTRGREFNALAFVAFNESEHGVGVWVLAFHALGRDGVFRGRVAVGGGSKAV